MADPLAGLLVLLIVIALCRWAFHAPRQRRSAPAQGFGLLLPVRVLPDAAAAQELVDRLSGAGVRATAAPAPPGFDAQGRPWPETSVQVLVFPSDFERARSLSRSPR